ncbi:hypothetical protein ACFL27_09620 [candidate division CSSED10-310 bacterium]|uniref:DUF4412 domain-containing protein n=1 Tax=candidate division CSSED10-310 bacterium TaxID=2855610 RepID=A0ABV6YW61_UNCC1
MRKILAIIIISMLCPSILLADTYIKFQVHTEAYYYGGVNHPAEEAEREYWIGEDKLVFSTRGRTIIFDRQHKQLLFINHPSKIYLESSLPPDWSKLVPEAVLQQLQTWCIAGKVSEKTQPKKIGPRKCQGYDFSYWIEIEGTREYDNDASIWVTQEVPFDLQVAQEFLGYLYILDNYNSQVIAQLQKMSGFPIEIERIRYQQGFGIKTTEKLTEMSEQKPPPGTYTVPEGFQKKDTLNLQDIIY